MERITLCLNEATIKVERATGSEVKVATEWTLDVRAKAWWIVMILVDPIWGIHARLDQPKMRTLRIP